MSANVARHLVSAAARDPGGTAIVAARGAGWSRVSFAELDARSSALAHGLRDWGLSPGETTLVMVRAGIDLIALTYALFKLGAVPVLIDPGMGRAAFLRSVEEAAPTAFLGIPLAHALRRLFPRSFRSVRHAVTHGRRLFWGGARLDRLERSGAGRGPFPVAPVGEDEPAAVLFTSGSTGPPKGALYSHGNFDAQVRILRSTYGFRPGEVDLAAFPLFSLFDCAFGMTSVIPDLDPSRPGRCDPAKVVRAIREHRATTAFGSPAIWKRVAPYCRRAGIRLEGVGRVLIAGAPVPPALIRELHAVIDPEGDVATPYGATEALPVASISGREIVGETAARTLEGGGTCVGRAVEGVEVRTIRIEDGPIASWSASLESGPGEVGELCVKGPVVTRAYHNLPEATALAKIPDGAAVWHRMGDLGYRDAEGRIWFCGRKAERLETTGGPLFTERVEGRLPGERRSALVGVGRRGQERPVLVIEGPSDRALAEEARRRLSVEAVLFHPRFPVDVRHNAKIHRLALKRWAEAQLGGSR